MARKKEEVAVENLDEMFKRYNVTIKFRSHFAAGLPKDPDKLLDFLNARKPKTKPEDAQDLEDVAEGIAANLPVPDEDEGEEVALTTTFLVVDDHLIYENRGVKSHIKECALILSGGIIPVKSLKSKVANRIQVEPEYIPLYTKEGVPIEKVDGHEIKPITVFVRGQGYMTAVKIVEYVLGATMKFQLIVLNDGVVTLEMLKKIFTYGGNIKGLGQDRNVGWGRYDFEIEEVQTEAEA